MAASSRAKLFTLVRWALAALAVGWAGKQLHAAWNTATLPAFTGSPLAVTGALLVTWAALLGLATVSWAGVLAAKLGSAHPLGWLWLRWFRLWFQSYVYRYIPGKVVLAAERARLGARLGIPPATGVLLVVWESGLLVAGAAVFGVVGILLRPPADEGLVSPGLAMVAAGVALAGCLAFPVVLKLVAARFPALGRKVPGLLLEVPVPAQLGLVFGNAICWLLLGLSFALTARLFAGAESVDLGSLVVWFVASYVLGQVSSVTPAGLGVREAVLVAALSNLAPAPLVLAWSVAARVMQSVAEFTLLGSSLFVTIPDAPPDEAPPPR